MNTVFKLTWHHFGPCVCVFVCVCVWSVVVFVAYLLIFIFAGARGFCRLPSFASVAGRPGRPISCAFFFSFGARRANSAMGSFALAVHAACPRGSSAAVSQRASFFARFSII